MPIEVHHEPPALHEPNHANYRPRGILKNPSFSGPSGRQVSPEKADITNLPPSASSDPQVEKDLTLQNTLQNAGHRRSSSAPRRVSASRRHSSTADASEDDPNKMRLQWDEANLYLAEQEKGGRMKITEPKTPYQYGDQGAMDEDEEEDVAIDPRYVNVDEVDMANHKSQKKARESEIPGLDIGEPEDEAAQQDMSQENDRIVRSGALSREGSKEKHASVSGEFQEPVGMPSIEEREKHERFEAMRRKHYEMKDVKELLGHVDDVDEEDENPDRAGLPALPSRGVNGMN